MNTLKLAVVGAGHLGKIHARLLSEMSDVELVAVVDPVEGARQQVASDCRTQALADYRPLVGQIDGAVIAVPTRFHHQVAVELLEHGIPLLIEKPLASDLAEAQQLVDAAHKRNTILQVGHVERFNPAFAAAAARIEQPRYVEAVRASGFTGRSVDIGVVYDLMIHDIDLLLALVGQTPVEVTAMGLALLGHHEDVAQARLRFANGCIASLSASRVSFTPAPRRQMQVWSARGFATIDFGARSAQFVSPSEEVLGRRCDFESLDNEARTKLKERLFSELLKVEPLEIPACNPLGDELRDFCAAIRTAGTPRVSGTAGRDAVAVAEAILNSIASHEWHGDATGPVGPLATVEPTILRGPHWNRTPQPGPLRREAS